MTMHAAVCDHISKAYTHIVWRFSWIQAPVCTVNCWFSLRFHIISPTTCVLLLNVLHRGVYFPTHLLKSLSGKQQDQIQGADLCSNQKDRSSWGHMMLNGSDAFWKEKRIPCFWRTQCVHFHIRLKLFAHTHFSPAALTLKVPKKRSHSTLL